MIAYKVKLEPDDNGTLLVTSAELPGRVTYEVDRDDKPCETTSPVKWMAAAARFA